MVKRGSRYALVWVLLMGLAMFVRAAPGFHSQAQAVSPAPETVAPQVWAATADGDETDFLVVLAEQADLRPMLEQAYPSREARLRDVYDALRGTALRAQADLRADLDAAGVAYRPFYVVNMLLVTGDRTLVTRLAARSDVAHIAANPRVPLALPDPRPDAPVLPRTPESVEWNVARVHAPDVWALGYTGQGVVVAGQDTGYDWEHPALIRQYRGYDADAVTHDYHWHDAIHSGGGVCGPDSPIPCDDNSHGTHTMGTILGDDSVGQQIGVAPGARWIGCRNMDEGVGTPATYAECFEFFLAPYPIGGDPLTEGVPELAPHVVNNSWTCPPSEGCDWETLQAVVEAMRAAGIWVVASAGNSGPSCSTVRDPIAIYDAVFTVGATDYVNVIASFSSRGPVTVDGSGRPKPDVAAPGVAIRSSVPGGGYGYKHGTSMAAPHVVGAAALLYSAAPDLVGDVAAAEGVITHTARPHTTTQICGDDGLGAVPNNVYGWGVLDALAAVRAVMPPLEVVKTASSDTVQPGAALTYTLRVTNTRDVTLTATITDHLPLHIEPGTTASGTTMLPGGMVTWTPALIPPGGEWVEPLVVTVAMGYAGPLTNVVRVSAVEGGAAVYTHTLPPPLQVTKRAASRTRIVEPGASLVYQLGFTNTLGFTLTDVLLTDVTPVGTTFAWADGGAAGPVTGTVDLGRTVVTWTVDSLPNGGELTATLAVTVGELGPGTRIVNDAYGVRAAELRDPVLGRSVAVWIPWRVMLPLVLRSW